MRSSHRQDARIRRFEILEPARLAPLCALSLVCAVAGGTVSAEVPERQDLDTVREFAAGYLTDALEARHQRVEVEPGRLDNRLRLHPCAEDDLEGFIPHDREPERASTIGVRCAGDAPWTVYVTVRSETYAEVVVARRGLQRGTRIQDDDIELAERDVSRIRDGWVDDPELVVGMQARRNIRQGRAIQSQQVEAPRWVRRGSRVVIEATSSNGLQITGAGEALEHGYEGERVRVRNLDSGREIEGRVVGPDRVEVAF